MQNCPANTVSAATTSGTAWSRSASSNTIIGALPPSSRPRRLRCSAAVAEIDFPVAVLPVKLITGTSGERTRTSPVTRPPVITLTTPAGSSSTSERIRAITALVCAVWPGRLSTAVVPAASAGASERIPRATGEFHGAMIPATPTGCRMTIPRSPPPTWPARPESVSASAALKRNVSGTMPTSSRPCGWILPFSRPRISTSSSVCASKRSAMRLSTRARNARSRRQVVSRNARSAAATAFSASSAPPAR